MNLRWVLGEYKRHFKAKLKAYMPSILHRNKIFKNLHAGQRCFILGSGHSIKGQDLSKLAGEIVITQNHFHVHKDIKLINPKYHVLVPKYQPSEFDSDWIDWLQSMNQLLPTTTTVFLGKNSKYLLNELNLFKERSFYIDVGLSDALVSKAPIDITKPIMSVPTVLTQCLAIALYMGFKEIYLLGFDLDQNVQLARGQDRNNVRFYGNSHITGNNAEVALEDAAGSSGKDWFAMWTIWHQCNLLKATADAEKISIFNATQGGLLNMFERKKYEDVFGGNDKSN